MDQYILPWHDHRRPVGRHNESWRVMIMRIFQPRKPQLKKHSQNNINSDTFNKSGDENIVLYGAFDIWYSMFHHYNMLSNMHIETYSCSYNCIISVLWHHIFLTINVCISAGLSKTKWCLSCCGLQKKKCWLLWCKTLIEDIEWRLRDINHCGPFGVVNHADECHEG